MLSGGDDISNDVIYYFLTLGTCFSLFVYIRTHLYIMLIGGNLTAQSTRSHRGIVGGIQIPETELQALFPFPAPPLAGRLAVCQFFPIPSNDSGTWPNLPLVSKVTNGHLVIQITDQHGGLEV